VVSLPAPLWDEYAPLYRPQTKHGESWQLDIARGVVLDSHALGFQKAGAAAEVSFEEQPCRVRLEGIVYTSVFNPTDGRKNWLDLITGFCFAFRDNPDVTLVMKLTYHDSQRACGLLWHEMKKLAPFRCRVIVVQGYLAADAYRQLVANSTYVVNTAYGEGQCLPLMEFMSAGKPAIAPNHSAMADYINGSNAFVVRSSEEWTYWPHDPRMMLSTFRYRINWESLRDAYLESWRVATSQPGEYLRMSRQAHQMLHQHCSRKAIAQRLKEFLEGLGYAPKYRSALILGFEKLIASLGNKSSAR
jgi:glycosyltransferase involved in cell wall biosynthesis